MSEDIQRDESPADVEGEEEKKVEVLERGPDLSQETKKYVA